MSNIEKIRQEIDTRRQHMVEELMGHEENCEYHRIKGMHDAYVDLLTFLDYSLPEEKPSEDLYEAAKNIYKVPFGTRAEDFIAGAEWQKEQMMKEAVEGVVCYGSKGAYVESDWLGTTDVEVYGDSGDKVKIVIIKDND